MDADALGRTLKLELDDGSARSLDEAIARATSYRLGVYVGPEVGQSRTATAALMTVVATARRAFRGGVYVACAADPVLPGGWGRGRRLSDAIQPGSLARDLPLGLEHRLAIATAEPGAGALYPTWAGWAGGVVVDPASRLAEDDNNPLAGVLAGALAVSEAFQSARGYLPAGRRDAGASLWNPNRLWRSADARGPKLRYLPVGLWLLGLGHLGQAIAWSAGCLPYVDFGQLELGLVDPQTVVMANVDTGLLTSADDVGDPKVRVVARQMQLLGVRTRLVERRFTEGFGRASGEPAVALSGFDRPGPRRALEHGGFLRVIDTGLGRGPIGYLEGILHCFPSSFQAADCFPDAPIASEARLLDMPAYRHEAEERQARGETADEIGCGLVEVAGRTVGAAFVGAVASTLSLAEELRALAGGPRFEVVRFSLRSAAVVAIENAAPGASANPGFVEAAA